MGFSKGVHRGRRFPNLPRPEAFGARELTPTGGFVVNETTGGFEGMSRTAQRVILLISFNVPDIRGFSTDQERAKWRQDAFVALRPLTQARPPVITDLTIVVESTEEGPDRNLADVNWVNAATGDTDGIQL